VTDKPTRGRPAKSAEDIARTRTIRLTDADFARFKALGIKRLRKWLRTAAPTTKEPTE
jgi:hypothetical protein